MATRLRPLLRLPAVLFPHQPVSFSRTGSSYRSDVRNFEISSDLLDLCWREFDGKLAVFGPGARIGTEVHIMYDNVLDSILPSPSHAVHAVGCDRVRLQRRPLQRRPLHAMCEVHSLVDEELSSEARLERLMDEAEMARDLIARGSSTGAFLLESSALDEELGGAAVCDPRCHPLFPLHTEDPSCASELSLWLGARLPLSTSLRISILSCLCPLRRLQDCVDAMRLLCDPNTPRLGHKFKIITTHPAHDAYCSTLGGATLPPRRVVTESPPSFTSWSDDKSFPHG